MDEKLEFRSGKGTRDKSLHDRIDYFDCDDFDDPVEQQTTGNTSTVDLEASRGKRRGRIPGRMGGNPVGSDGKHRINLVMPQTTMDTLNTVCDEHGASVVSWLKTALRFRTLAEKNGDNNQVMFIEPNGSSRITSITHQEYRSQFPANSRLSESGTSRYNLVLGELEYDGLVSDAVGSGMTMTEIIGRSIIWGLKITDLLENDGRVTFSRGSEKFEVYIPSFSHRVDGTDKDRYNLVLPLPLMEELEARAERQDITFVGLVRRYIDIGNIIRDIGRRTGMRMLLPVELEIANQEKEEELAASKHPNSRHNLLLPTSEMNQLQGLANHRGLTLKDLLSEYIKYGTTVDDSMSQRGSVLFAGLNSQETIDQQRAIFI